MSLARKYRKLRRAHKVDVALREHAAGNALFYYNNTTDRAELCGIGGRWGFQYTYNVGTEEIRGSMKFVRATAHDAIAAFFAAGKHEYLLIDEAPEKSVDDDEFGITITVPKGTKVTIIEV